MFSAAWSKKNLYAIHKAWFVNLSARLVSIDLSDNCIKELPEELFNILPALEELDVSKNQLKSLPEVISSYTRYNAILYGNNVFVNCKTLCPQKGESFIISFTSALWELKLGPQPIKNLILPSRLYFHVYIDVMRIGKIEASGFELDSNLIMTVFSQKRNFLGMTVSKFAVIK